MEHLTFPEGLEGPLTDDTNYSNMVQVLARQVVGGKCNMGNAVISVCAAAPLGKHKENTEISPTETLQQWLSDH